MPIETQNSFVGGLNDRLPAHKIPQNAVQEAIDCDFSFDDVRSDSGIGGTGGGSEYFYEAGKAWIGTDGVGGQATYPIQTYSSNTTISSSASLGTPLIVNENITLTVNSGQTVTVNDVVRGIHNIQSFVEYADDLYMGRDDFTINVSSVVANTTTITVPASDIYKFIVGDVLTADFLPDNTKVKSINIASAILTLTKQSTNGGSLSNVVINVKSTPIRLIDGDISNVYKVGLDTPKIGITIGQLDTGQNTSRSGSHSDNFYTTNPPVAFRYGIARYDDATLAESGMSSPSDLTQSQQAVSGANNDTPLTVEFNNKSICTITIANPAVITVYSHGLTVGERVQFTSSGSLPSGLTEGTSYYVSSVPNGNSFQISTTYGGSSLTTTGSQSGVHTLHYKSPEDGKYAVYRIGDASAIFKKAYNLFYKDTFNVSANVSSATITFTITNAPATGTLYAEFYSYESTKYTEGNTYDANDASLTKRLTLAHTTSNAFTITSNTSTHRVDLIIYIENTADDDDRTYVVTGDEGGCVNVHTTSVYNHQLIDFKKSKNLVDIEPVLDSDLPPAGLKHLVEINNFFYGAKNKRLHISSFARPNNWPLDGFLDFDANITALKSRGGECIVFTEFGLYRVYGNAHNAMRKVRVPTTEGIEEGFFKCVANLRDNIVYKSHSGISIFNGRDVNVLTQPALSSFTVPSGSPSNNCGGVIEDVYYLIASTGEGYRVDLRFGNMKLSKSSINGNNLWYRGITNKLYSPDGFIGGGDALPFTFHTRDFTLNDINSEKVLSSISVTGSEFKGSIEIYADGVLSETFVVDNTVNELNRNFYPSASIIANRFSVRFVDCIGKIQNVSVDLEMTQNLARQRFDAVTFIYIGSPSVQVKVDNISKISSTLLTDSGNDKTETATLYFPAMTEGYIPHVIANETETNRIISKVFQSEAI